MNTSDFGRFYPKENVPDFLQRVRKEWKNLKAIKTEGKDCTASVLFLHLRTGKREPIKHTVFVFWLLICIDRPWEWNWKCSLRKEVRKKIADILKRSGVGGIFSAATLRRYIKKKNFKGIIYSPIEWDQIMKSFIPERDKFMKKVRLLPQNKSAEWPRVLTKESFDLIRSMGPVHEYVRSQKYINRRALMRKFKLDKFQCELLLDALRDYIKIKEWPGRSVWIWSTEP